MNDIIFARDLGAQFNLSGQQVGQILRRAKLPTVLEFPSGSGMVKAYDRTAAVAAVQKFIDENRPAPEPTPAPEPAPAPQPSVDTSMMLTMVQTAVTTAVAGAMVTLLDELREMDERAAARDRELMRAFQALSAVISVGAHGQAQAPVDDVDDAPAPPVEAPAAKPTQPDAKPCVLIAGLPPSTRARVEQEFGSVFKLIFIDSDETGRPGTQAKMKTCAHTIAMAQFLNHGLGHLAGKGVIRVTGGLSALRDTLTELYVKAAA